MFTWSDPNDDAMMKAVGQKVIFRAKSLAQEMGLYHPFIYKNYADAATDVYSGYGIENREKMREIQGKYDPAGVFSRLQSGSHKV